MPVRFVAPSLITLHPLFQRQRRVIRIHAEAVDHLAWHWLRCFLMDTFSQRGSGLFAKPVHQGTPHLLVFSQCSPALVRVLSLRTDHGQRLTGRQAPAGIYDNSRHTASNKRYEICSYEEMEYETVEMDFATKDEALLWVCKKHLATVKPSSTAYRFQSLCPDDPHCLRMSLEVLFSSRIPLRISKITAQTHLKESEPSIPYKALLIILGSVIYTPPLCLVLPQ